LIIEKIFSIIKKQEETNGIKRFIRKIILEAFDFETIDSLPEEGAQKDPNSIGEFKHLFRLTDNLFVATRIDYKVNGGIKKQLGFNVDDKLIRIDYSLNDNNGDILPAKTNYNYKILIKIFATCLRLVEEFVKKETDINGIILYLETENLNPTSGEVKVTQEEIDKKERIYNGVLKNNIKKFPGYNYKPFNISNDKKGFLIYKIDESE
jgi:hypothetical protein